jgi:outer membrane protein OmpA-like peptidoglycan-associated protein/tetratricopeptide (TPR) repeat protein
MENIPAKPQIHEYPLIKFFLIGLIVFSNFSVFSQDHQESASKKAKKLFDKALNAYRMGDASSCEEHLSKAIKEDSTYSEAWILYGDVFYETGRLEQSINAYRNALEYNPLRPGVVRELLAEALFQGEYYGEALVEYELLLNSEGLRHDLRQALMDKIEIAGYRKSLMDNPFDYQLKNLGPSVNTTSDEYINLIGAESDQLTFTRKMAVKSDNPVEKDFKEDFYRSLLKDTGWSVAEKVSFTSSSGDAGGLSISADGRLLFFTACFRPDSKGSCDLYYSEKLGDTWSLPKNMGDEINSDNWDAQPSISPDGNTLYFASNRRGSMGSSDIWKTQRLPGGAWTRPENLGAQINTSDAEMAPFIHYDNESLYFSSRGHMGMGGQDLFVSKREQPGWSEPKNLGYPLNSKADELVTVVSPDGKKAFISARLPGGLGGYDIYSYRMPEQLSPNPVTYMKGKVFDADTYQPLQAEFELIDLISDSLIMSSLSSGLDGTFLICVPLGKNYALNVSSPGYLFYSAHFKLDKNYSQADPYLRDVPLEPLDIGKTAVLNNIFFDTDQYSLKEESRTELKKLLDFLTVNPGLYVEISGHTDNVGSQEYNLTLSNKRATAVLNYLIDAGIEAGRLSSAGYGFSRPVAGNDTEEGRAENRRTEMKVIRLD